MLTIITSYMQSNQHKYKRIYCEQQPSNKLNTKTGSTGKQAVAKSMKVVKYDLVIERDLSYINVP